MSIRGSMGPVVLVLAMLPSVARAADSGQDEADLVRWIERACPGEATVETLARLDQMAGKAIMDHMRQGRYRTAVVATNAYLACWERQKVLLESGIARSRVKALRQIACFVPLVVFESEGRVDRDLARASLARCPEPPEVPEEADAAGRRSWAEDVRRRMHLVAATRQPGDVLDEAERWLARLKEAGVREDVSQEVGKADGDAAEVTPPDPVFAIRVLAVGAAVGSGSVERLVQAFGGESEACSSMFLAALGFLQAVEMPRQAALPMILKALVAEASLETLAGLSEKVTKRFQDRPCAVQSVVASLALSSLASEVVDLAVAEGRTELVARLAASAPAVIPVHGSPRSRIAVLQALPARLKGEERNERLCQLGDAQADAGEPDGALATFSEASARAQEAGIVSPCATGGRLRAMILAGRAGEEPFVQAATEWLKGGPGGREVLERLLEPGIPQRRVGAVAGMAAVVRAKDAPGRESVMEALVKVVDDRPGSPEADAAREAVDAAGFPEDAEGKVTWALVSGRHLAVAGEAAESRKAFERAFSGMKKDMKSAREGAVALVRWAALDARYGLLDDLVDRARKAGLLTPTLLAELAGTVGEIGERARACRYVAMARGLKPRAPEEWIALADASARIDDAPAAARDLRHAGPDATWGPEAWMVQGRIATIRGHHREAVAAYGKAVEGSPGECQPRFFRGLALLLVGDPEGAQADFEACVDDGNLGPQVVGALGYAQFDQSRFDDAEATFRRALQRDPKAADNHLGLAMVMLRKGSVEEARASLAKAVELEPALGKGPKAAALKGFVYSDVQKKAWDDLRALGKGGAK